MHVILSVLFFTISPLYETLSSWRAEPGLPAGWLIIEGVVANAWSNHI